MSIRRHIEAQHTAIAKDIAEPMYIPNPCRAQIQPHRYHTPGALWGRRGAVWTRYIFKEEKKETKEKPTKRASSYVFRVGT